MKTEEIKGKNILILGFGREGEDTLNFMKEIGSFANITIADKKENLSISDKSLKLSLGDDYLKNIEEYDLIIKSPGIPIDRITPLIKEGTIITSQSDIFLDNVKGTVIGITGTKGKSTTSSLITNILKKKGLDASLVGNIGEPTLKYLKDDNPDKIYVYELSSFQLETVNKSPNISIILNLYKDHLDHHKNFKDYVNAKSKITQFQKEDDILIFNKEDPIVKEIALKSKAKKIPFNPKNDPLGIRKDITVPAEVLLIVSKIFDISDELIIETISSFTPLPHRLENVGRYKGITFYNDSAATIPEAAISAINKIGPDLDTLITGGVDKGFSLKELSDKIVESSINNLILFPETGKKIEEFVSGKLNIFHAEDMKTAVEIAFLKTEKGKSCLLAPAASSFNMFKDYQERGNLFKKYVKDEKA